MCAPVVPAPAQVDGPEGLRAPEEAVLAYMERLGLTRLMAAELGQRMSSVQGAERVALAERLGRLYVELINVAEDAEQRRVWEERSRELLRMVPDSDSFDLRINLAKALYLQAEETVERQRLRLATTDEVAEAERVLRSLKPQLEEMGAKVHRRVEALEKLEESGESSEQLAEELANGRRLRSQAFYYEGWCSYYLAYLTRTEEAAIDGLKAFGWLLNSRGGRIPTLDRLPKGLLKYEHVARAAIGCGLCSAMRGGGDTAALRWFDAVDEEPELSDAVKEHLLPRRIAVLAGAKRWADLERLVRLTRRSQRGGGGPDVKRLPVGAARLLAVLTLEAGASQAGEVVEELAAIALGDLVATGEVAHVLDLVSKYGTAPIGETGFIVHYVRGLQQYERARSAHKGESNAASTEAEPRGVSETGEPESPIEPSERPEVVNLYRLAAEMFGAAVRQEDAGSFAAERGRASMLAGMSLYYAGEAARAAERFAETAKMAATREQAGEAMWLAVLALDHAARKDDPEIQKKRDEAAVLYLQSYPDGERAAKLLLRRAMSGGLDNEEALRTLLGVTRESALYPAARQHASRILYSLYRAAGEAERDFAALRFVGVAEEVLAMDRRIAIDGADREAAEAAQRVVTRTRQILDALLNRPTPDPARAEAALAALNDVAVHHALDLAEHQAEILFRRLQIALAKDDAPAAESLASQVALHGGQFAIAADQLMYRRVITRLNRLEQAAEKSEEIDLARRQIVEIGRRLIRIVGARQGAMNDPAVLSLYDAVAEASLGLWDAHQDPAMRDLSIQLDRTVLAVHPGSGPALKRLARSSELAGDEATSLECWRTLLSGIRAPDPAWFEARYHSIRLLAPTDAARAREAMRQHVLLYPSLGPEPWRRRLKELADQIGVVPGEPAEIPNGKDDQGGQRDPDRGGGP